jgi:uncharacterized protein
MIPVGDGTLKDILSAQRTFAMVGASGDPNRPSHGVMAYLQARGFRIIPVNPALAGQELMGETVYASLADVPGPVDVVDIFRRSDAALDVVREAIAGKDRLGLKTIWMQIGVINATAADEARAAGLTVVMNLCPKIEYARLMR